MAGLIPAIPTVKAPRLIARDHRHKPGDDIEDVTISYSKPGLSEAGLFVSVLQKIAAYIRPASLNAADYGLMSGSSNQTANLQAAINAAQTQKPPLF